MQWYDSMRAVQAITAVAAQAAAFKFKCCAMQAAQLAASEHTLASPEATAQAYIDHFVNGTEIDGLTPLHLALCNGVCCIPPPGGTLFCFVGWALFACVLALQHPILP